ncbi:MAG: ribonuclease H-like domain-containing protein [Bacteroidia bacterium]|nr:ribonuclease H-like domain-containing protein [Bacteroidia bacterium]MCX7651733.1 ribonuclease H-like domain-containing protein [Bacteroidia bacterium]MDW8416958.1 ribonuclease H-like domain-containing protein [Bacteroidia bacterium]
MNQDLAIERILFLDIETCPAYRSLGELPSILREYWKRRYDERRAPAHAELDQEEYFQMQAGIHALYARVVCISMGYFYRNGNNNAAWQQLSIYDLDESKILLSFAEKWNSFKGYMDKVPYSQKERANYGVCGHNIANFDIPFLGRRFLIMGLALPDFWRVAQWAPPWQLKEPTVLDTMALWNFTNRENSYISLEMLAFALGIHFQKALYPSEIYHAFQAWEASREVKEFLPVVEYCEKDVRVTAEIYLRMQLRPEVREPYISALRNYEENTLTSTSSAYESPHN